MDIINLQLKENALDAWTRLDAFWQGEMIERPIVCVTAPAQRVPAEHYDDNYYARIHSDLDSHAKGVLNNFSTQYYGGEAFPSAFLSLGCDEMAAFCGGELRFSPDSVETNWSLPFVKDWNAVLPLAIDDNNPLWQRMLSYISRSAEMYHGKMLIDPIDFHSNMDFLMAVRGSEDLCVDLIERPEIIDRAMENSLDIFMKVWKETRKAGGGTVGLGATLQCDFSCMISPAMFRRWALPILEEEAKTVGRVTYHWDGITALTHTDDIIASKGLYCIAFVPGAGNGTHADYVELYQKIQAGGKAVSVYGPPDMMKWMHRQLDPRLTVYHTHTSTRQEAEELLAWFRQNT